MDLSRRRFLQMSMASAGSLFFPDLVLARSTYTSSDPHFFLFLVMVGAADSSYMFDARPLSMTKAKKIQNYWSKNGEKPVVWQGKNGNVTLATPLVKPLEPFRDDFSVINGVVMTPTFDGHLQNMNFLFANNAFGGDSFIPDLNLKTTGRTPQPLDAVNPADSVQMTVSNHSRVLELVPEALGSAAGRLKAAQPPSTGNELNDFILSRQKFLSQGPGRLSLASALMNSSLLAAPDLQAKLSKVSVPSASASPLQQSLGMIADCFRLGISRSAIFACPEDFDVHSTFAAKKQSDLFKSAIDRLAETLKFLKNTAYDSQKSLFDVTTIMVASEMGRTLRIEGLPIDDTGTNHNQFSNSILLGGKGIKGGLVVGASDMIDEKASVSKAHLSVDPIQEKLLGQPFDFATFQSRIDQPQVFDIQDYLTVASVVNTVLTAFHVPATQFKALGRQLPVAPVLQGLLV